MKYRDIYSVRLQFHDISLRHASKRCAPQMITLVGLVVTTAQLTILDCLVILKILSEQLYVHVENVGPHLE